MKKSLIALAVLAASGAAMAQSSVTVYGRVDASIGSETVTTNGVKAPSQTKVFNGSDGGLTGSRWGLRGVEDLGGGLKAVFVLEQRFNVDDGAVTSASGLAEGFNGDAYVGLTGGFGTLHLGRTYTVYDGIKAMSIGSSVFDSAFTPTAQPAYTVRGANLVKYVSPTFAGITVAGSVSLKEAAAKNVSALSATYAGGPLKVGVGFEAAATGDNTMISGAYDFGVASISAGYATFDADGTGTDASGLNLGVTVPMGAFKFSVGLRDGKTESKAGAKITDLSGFGMGVTYSLSKRTTAYAGYSDVKTKTIATGLKSGTKKYAVGIRHDF